MCAFDFLFGFEELHDNHPTNVILGEQESLPCIAPLLATVEGTPQTDQNRFRALWPPGGTNTHVCGQAEEKASQEVGGGGGAGFVPWAISEPI